MSADPLPDQRNCVHGNTYCPPREPLDPFEVKYGVTTEGKRRCNCCGRYWSRLPCPFCIEVRVALDERQS